MFCNNTIKMPAIICVLCLVFANLPMQGTSWALSVNQSVQNQDVRHDVHEVVSLFEDDRSVSISHPEKDVTLPSKQPFFKWNVDTSYRYRYFFLDEIDGMKAIRAAGYFFEMVYSIVAHPFRYEAWEQIFWYYLFFKDQQEKYQKWVFKKRFAELSGCAKFVARRYLFQCLSPALLNELIAWRNSDMLDIIYDILKKGRGPRSIYMFERNEYDLRRFITPEVFRNLVLFRHKDLVELAYEFALNNEAIYAKEIYTEETLLYALEHSCSYIIQQYFKLAEKGRISVVSVFSKKVLQALISNPATIRAAVDVYLFRPRPIEIGITRDVADEKIRDYQAYVYPLDANIEWEKEFSNAMKDIIGRLGGRRALDISKGELYQFLSTIEQYLQFWTGHKDALSNARELHAVGSYYVYMGNDIREVLDPCRDIGVPLSYFTDIVKAVKGKNALLQIFSFFNRGRKGVPTHFKTVKTLIATGCFDDVYYIVLEIARMRGVQAPQEIDSLFSVIADEIMPSLIRNGMDVASYDWVTLGNDIKEYYQTGLPSLTTGLYRLYKNNSQDVLDAFLAELEQVMNKPIRQGQYPGLTNEFLCKYNLSDEDELALLTSFIPIESYTTKYYAPKFSEVKKILHPLDTWQKPVDRSFRSYVTFRGKKTHIVYGGQESFVKRYEVFADLCELLTAKKGSLYDNLEKALINDNFWALDYATVIAQEALTHTNISAETLQRLPQSEEEAYEFCKLWYHLLYDVVKKEVRPRMRAFIRETILKMPENDLKQSWFYKLYSDAVYLRHLFTDETGMEMKRTIVADQVFKELKRIYIPHTQYLRSVLRDYTVAKMDTKEQYRLAYSDDVAFSMSPMRSTLCTFGEILKQLNSTKHHFGSLIVQDKDSRLLGVSHVQFAKSWIKGKAKKTSKKGWGVLAVSTSMVSQDIKAFDHDDVLLSLLACAQILSEKAGLQGAVIPQRTRLHGRRGFEMRAISELIAKGWLIPRKLSDDIVYTDNPNYCPAPFIYKDVYEICLPDYVLARFDVHVDERNAIHGATSLYEAA